MYFRSRKKSAGDVSLSDSLDGDNEDANLSLMDVLADDTDLLERISTEELGQQARRYVSQILGPKEAEIIRLRYGLSGQKPLTQREVAEVRGISRSYVSGRG